MSHLIASVEAMRSALIGIDIELARLFSSAPACRGAGQYGLAHAWDAVLGALSDAEEPVPELEHGDRYPDCQLPVCVYCESRRVLPVSDSSPGRICSDCGKDQPECAACERADR